MAKDATPRCDLRLNMQLRLVFSVPEALQKAKMQAFASIRKAIGFRLLQMAIPEPWVARCCVLLAGSLNHLL